MPHAHTPGYLLVACFFQIEDKKLVDGISEDMKRGRERERERESEREKEKFSGMNQ
jgi:hypothetical protein